MERKQATRSITIYCFDEQFNKQTSLVILYFDSYSSCIRNNMLFRRHNRNNIFDNIDFFDNYIHTALRAPKSEIYVCINTEPEIRKKALGFRLFRNCIAVWRSGRSFLLKQSQHEHMDVHSLPAFRHSQYLYHHLCCFNPYSFKQCVLRQVHEIVVSCLGVSSSPSPPISFSCANSCCCTGGRD